MDAIKRLYIEQVVNAVISKIVTAVPFLGWPVINQIFSTAVTKLAMAIFDMAEEIGMMIVIDFKVDSQKEKYESATEKYKNVLYDLTKTPEEIERAKNEYKKRLRNLVMLNAS